MVLAGRHAAVLLSSLLHVVLIRHSLLGVHGYVGRDIVATGHMALRDPRTAALGRDMLSCRFFGGFDLVAIDAILVAGRWFRCIQTCL